MIWDLQKYSDNTAALDEYETVLTYQELDAEGRHFAEAVGRRCLTFVLCRNGIGAVVGYTGALNAGIVPLLLSSRLDEELLAGLLTAYQPSCLWVPEDMTDSESLPSRHRLF